MVAEILLQWNTLNLWLGPAFPPFFIREQTVICCCSVCQVTHGRARCSATCGGGGGGRGSGLTDSSKLLAEHTLAPIPAGREEAGGERHRVGEIQPGIRIVGNLSQLTDITLETDRESLEREPAELRGDRRDQGLEWVRQPLHSTGLTSHEFFYPMLITFTCTHCCD